MSPQNRSFEFLSTGCVAAIAIGRFTLLWFIRKKLLFCLSVILEQANLLVFVSSSQMQATNTILKGLTEYRIETLSPKTASESATLKVNYQQGVKPAFLQVMFKENYDQSGDARHRCKML